MRSEGSVWQRRRKRRVRVLVRDLRVLAPALGVLACFVSSAGVIVAAETVPPERVETVGDYFRTSSSSTSNESAAPAGMRPVLRLP